MDLSQLPLISHCEDECSLTHEQVEDIVPIEIDPQNANEQLKDDSLVNCRSKHKLIDEEKNVKEPKEGMLFGSTEELLEYYRNYVKQEGFGVVQKKKKKYENGDVHYITLACARQGNASSSSSNSLSKPMKTSKTGCRATVSATLVDTMWYVTNVNLGHNHDLSPGKARYIRCHKKLDLATKRKLDIDDRAGIRTNKIYNSLAVEAGGYENLTFGEKECRNYIANSRRLRLGTGGATALRDYFDRMQKVDSDFYFEMDVDDEFRLKNVFWADARKKFGSNSQYKAIKSAIRSCVYNSQTCDEFDAKWQSVLECYNLEENAWLRDLYSERSFWIPAYLNSIFWPGMTTTQRSESMNAFFDGYVHSSTSLKEFVDQYDNALRRKVEVENVADFDSFHTTISCVSRYPFEKQFQKMYTHAKFKEVQKEISEIMYCGCSRLESEGGINTYQVIEKVEISDSYIKKVCFTVYYNGLSCDVSCSCHLFEARGILCRHAMSVLTIGEDVKLLPDKYFLNRWRKDLERPYKLIKSSYDPLSGNPTADRYDELSKNMLKLAAIVAPNVDHCTEVQNYVDMLTNKFSGPRCEQSPSSQSLPSAKLLPSASRTMTGDGVEVCSPLVAHTKGRKPSNRKVSAVEKAVKKSAASNKSATNPNQQRKQQRKKKQPCQRSLVDELDTSEDPFTFVTDVLHDQVIGTHSSVVTQIKDLKGILFDLLVPGMMVNARVQSILENDVMLSFLTYLQ
ncbi:protein FAR-RED IMPAIRED RESPONSE 1-like [Alnus glutinosa]|uniref:protein FAR-RED IMPAIRED RESPONSE 1-like n=1 Tax=Alnus glutinosa TaxID=3517 RepID=UPI002D79BC8C|nr:protein FAR-RED IMPAIRED RESPONSE 1-like [Alnus glutinosa]